MKQSGTFRDILHQKIMQHQSEQMSSTDYNQDFQRAHFQWETSGLLLGKIQKIQFQTTAQKTYPRTKSSGLKTRKPHSLDQAQSVALAFFQKFKMDLTETFTQKELKKAFRLLALRLHPDKNGGLTAPYLELKENYTLLLKVFKQAI